MTLHELIERLEKVNTYIDTYKVKFICYQTENVNLQIDNIEVNDTEKIVIIELKDE